ncbi:MAG: hypothetical protein KGL19_08650 [Bacteroidota bacterium]|nr:hypothetical protein [Bacteroidota bacterium]
MKTLLFILLLSADYCFAQQTNCVVNVKELQGTYVGDCKKGMANGKGKAVGEDTYEGEFKNGIPEGTGKYTWKNGTWYEGNFKKGIEEGEGVMHYVSPTNKDSIIAGYWKKGSYVGLYEKAYKIISKSYMVNTATVEELKTSVRPYQIEIYLTSVSGGAPSISNLESGGSGQLPKPEITSVLVNKGSYLSMDAITNTNKSNFYYLKDIVFPFSVIFKIGQEDVSIDFYKPSNYKVDIKIKQ